MTSVARAALVLAASTAFIASQPLAQEAMQMAQAQGGGTSPRPTNPTANLPSDTGSQTTLPSGAVTGAGQPQGTTRQPDVGNPGGLERRAREKDRATRTGAEGRAPAAGAGEREGAADGAPRARPPRRSKG